MENQPKQVFACIDGSRLTQAVCDYAAWISKKTATPLKLLHTINHHPEVSITSNYSGNIGLGSQEELLEEFIEIEQQHSKLKLKQGKRILTEAKEHLQQQGIENPICIQRHGDLIESLLEMESNFRVLVLGLRGQVHEDKNGQIGSKLETIIRALHCPILIVNETFTEPQHIMLAYDGSQGADKAVDMVSTSPLYKGLTCHLVCVNDNQKTATKLLEQAQTKLQQGAVQVISEKIKGKPEQALCDYQQQHAIDLTVMGAFSHNRLHDIVLGSFTRKMLLNTTRPLLLLR